MERDTGVVRGEVWWATAPGGDRPVLVLTRDPVADRIGAVVVVVCTRTIRGLMSELPLGVEDGLPEACVAAFDNIHTLPRHAFRRRICRLSDARMADACRVLGAALGCI
jgi:mRNA interferase MazF